MRGQVLGVDQRSGDGLVAGEDGQRYRFTPADWAQRGEPAIGVTVDFETAGDHALNVFPLPVPGGDRHVLAAPPTRVVASDRNKFVAALLAFFLGTLGVHRFYLGRTGSAVTMLVLTFTVVGMLVSGPWALIDALRYLFMSEREFAVRYARPA
ncbi:MULTISPECIES: TM2 domain-containing protein [unclassified Sphingomonas]|uniref:TM2 domain-containing protein n=1 Tax=unclassified Sphingomonas TaxID=196159 RepID=UPI00045326EB|nr:MULTISPECIES: TM2 domain-containing protein [unclassified Sphingomonas]EZP52968.1 TM2 domain protein [Sphingomonas sp. RIT328]